MPKTLEFIENRIRWRASQHDIPNKISTFFFENLTPEEQSIYLSDISKKDIGKIILIFKDSKKNWTGIGTKVILGYNGTEFQSVELNQIKDVDSKNRKEYKAESENLKPKKFNKKNERELLIIDALGNETVFVTKKGHDLFSLWNIMLMITQFNE